MMETSTNALTQQPKPTLIWWHFPIAALTFAIAIPALILLSPILLCMGLIVLTHVVWHWTWERVKEAVDGVFAYWGT